MTPERIAEIAHKYERGYILGYANDSHHFSIAQLLEDAIQEALREQQALTGTPKTVGVLEALIRDARKYRADAKASLERNEHTHKSKKTDWESEDIDAVLVDFINYIAYLRCVDLALYAVDLEAEA